MSQRPKIVLLSSRDVTNHKAYEHYSIAKALNNYVGDVIPIQYPRPIQKYSYGWVKHKLSLLNRKSAKVNALEASMQYGYELGKILNDISFDILFAPMGSKLIAFLDIKQPIVYLSDATFRLLNNQNSRKYYFKNGYLSREQVVERENIELYALNNASIIIPSNNWAAKSMIDDYKIDLAKIHVILSGPNLDYIPEKCRLKKSNPLDRLNLLMVGRNWECKGGDIGLKTLQTFCEFGYNTHLTICGMSPPDTYDKNNITVFDFLNKNNTNDYEKLIDLYNSSHFLLFPTRADCSAISMSEANALGTPVIATDVGGLSSYIIDNRNGVLMPYEAKGIEYTNKIIEIINSNDSYKSLCVGARQEYETRLNWKCWSDSINNIINL